MTPLGRLLRDSVLPMLKKEFIQLRRDRFTAAMLVGIPAIQLALFGYAVQTEVRHQPLVVLDQSATSESRALVHTMINTGNFDFAGAVRNPAELDEALLGGRAGAALVIPPQYAADLTAADGATAQLIVDAADPLSSGGAIAAAGQAALIESQRHLRRQGVSPPISVRIRPRYNPASRSAVYIVPGVIGVLLTLTMVLVASMAIVRERELGTMEQLIVTPIARQGIMLGKLLPFLIVGYVQVLVILILGGLLFRVPFEGSLLLLLVACLPFIAASLGVGLLLSTVVRTQTQAIQLAFFFLLPNILLSGFMFPVRAMPAPAQWISAALPLTYFLELLRGTLLKGAGWAFAWKNALVLTAFAVALLVTATLRFRKTLD